MKVLLTLFIFITAGTFAKAETLLNCRLAEKDLVHATVSTADGKLTLTETTQKGELNSMEISQSEWDNQWIRLSDSAFGFRYLAHMYSDFFNEFGWFVETRGGLSYSISRADCE